MSHRNSAKEGQCTRDASCTKGRGHAGWCATKGGRTGKKGAQDQDSLLAAAALRQQPTRSKPGSKAAAMAELGARRKSGKRSRLDDYAAEEDEEEDDDEDFVVDDDDDEDYGGDDGAEYEDFGMSRSDRKAMRRGAAPDAHAADEADAGGWAKGGPAAPLETLETIRLERRLLEKWLLEPFFAKVVRGCLVRIGLNCETAEQVPGARSTIYRAAEVCDVAEFDDHPYTLGSHRTTKRLQLRFGECRQWYPMASVSNQRFEELELLQWQQVLDVTDDKQISAAQVEAKAKQLQDAMTHVYSEADVAKRIQEQRKQAVQQGKPAQLTTRQKLAMSSGSEGGPSVSKPKKFERNVLGQAVVADHDD